MDTYRILAELRTEHDRLTSAIDALELTSNNSRGGAGTGRSRGQHGLTPEGRRRLSEMMKQRWAQRRAKLAAKAQPTRASKSTRRISKAGRRRIAAAQRARWARLKQKKTIKTA